MNKSINRAFTLIELLVVIAIIAILAAILFPVFAQAKAAAKATVALSDSKEMGLAQLMYMSDNDDYFSPVSTFDVGWEIRPFDFLQQPYMKSWGIVMDPLSPATINSDPMVIRSQWGMPPLRAATVSTSDQDYMFGRSAQGAAFTGGKLYRFEGIAGVGKDPANDGQNWASWNYKDGGVASLTQSSVARPADMLMESQSGTYDFMWQFANWGDGPDNWDRYWADGTYNLYGDNDMICGPLARVRASGADAGWIPIGSEATATLPKGNVIYTAVDGHAKSIAWSQLVGTTITLPDGTLAIKDLYSTQ